jgi:hypothetical protein
VHMVSGDRNDVPGPQKNQKCYGIACSEEQFEANVRMIEMLAMLIANDTWV